MNLHLDPVAYSELIEAAAWYDSRLNGLGDDFLDAANQAIDAIRLSPDTGSVLETLDDPRVRRVLLRRFPYAVIYEVFDDQVHVLAVAHTSRKPNYWTSRRDES